MKESIEKALRDPNLTTRLPADLVKVVNKSVTIQKNRASAAECASLISDNKLKKEIS
jgi:hypothetical protein